MYYDKKRALENKGSDQIIAASTLKNYIILDDYHTFLQLINSSQIKQFYEYIDTNSHVNLFFDIEMYKKADEHIAPGYYTNYKDILRVMKESVESLDFLKQFEKRYIITEAHDDTKRSFHVVVRLVDSKGDEWYFESVDQLKQLHAHLNLGRYKSVKPPDSKKQKKPSTSKKPNKPSAIFDSSVYRDGLFRTIYSSKDGEEILRPFKRSIESDNFTQDVETFVGYTTTKNLIKVPIFKKRSDAKTSDANTDTKTTDIEKLDVTAIKLLKDFVSEKYSINKNQLQDPFIDENECIIIPSSDKYCHFEQRQHKSNNQYFVMDSYSIKQKCHDSECGSQKHNELTVITFPDEMLQHLSTYITFKTLQQIDSVKQDSIKMINLYDPDASNVVYDSDSNVFKSKTTIQCFLKLKGQCDTCETFHILSSEGYRIKCVVCGGKSPAASIPLHPNSPTAMFFTQNHTNTLDESYMHARVKLDPSIYNDKVLTELMSTALNGHQQSILAEFFCRVNNDFKYYDNKWYYCVNNIWQTTKENYILGRVIGEVLAEQLKKIIVHYKLAQTDEMYINIDKLVIFLRKASTHRELPNLCKPILEDKNIEKLLDSKHHLLPFKNGVCEFLKESYVFRQIEKGDYIRTCLDYDYNPNVDTTKFDNMLSMIIRHTDVREYMLQQFSKILNGNTPNTMMYILTGVGSNGKSLLMNFINDTFGFFADKSKISMLTYNGISNSNNADPEVHKLKNLRMICFSEPNPNDKLNGSILKELTGGESVSARALRQDPESFKVRAKMFLTCNYVPEINESSEALWRRLHIVHFDSRFVDKPDPDKNNEFKIDTTLPSKIENDMDYSNGLIRRLIEYYYKPAIPVPKVIEDKTAFYIESSNTMYTWLRTNVVEDDNGYILTEDLVKSYIDSNDEDENLKIKKQLVHAMQNFIANNFTNLNAMQHRFRVNGDRPHGWKGVRLIDRDNN